MAVHLLFEDGAIRANIHGSDFKDSLARIKSIPGRRWMPEDKYWALPKDYQTAQRLMHVCQPTLAPDVRDWLEAAAEANETALASNIPEDAETFLPWNDDLFPHQRAAVEWMCKHPAAIEADDMGLGKTVTSISAVIQKHYEESVEPPTVLVICPNSITENWAEELEFGPCKPDGTYFENWAAQPWLIINGKTKKKREQQLEEAKKGGKWVIVNWEKLRIMPELAKIKWDAVLADEAHRAKNRKSKQTAALWALKKVPIKFALTGTPIQNEPSELWPLLKWLYPTVYTSYWAFFDLYVDYYEGQFGRVITGVKHPEGLRFELADKLIRRLKGSRTPGKYRDYFPVRMDTQQKKMYDEAEKEMWLNIIKDAEGGDTGAIDLVANPDKLFLSNGAARTTRLRQILSTPALLGSTAGSAKLDAAVDIISDAPATKQFVVFTEFKGTVAALCERLEKKKIPCAGLTGDTPVSRTKATPEDVFTRQELVHRFQEGQTRVLVMTRAAGGVGLTLTAASTCIFIERDWVPANNEQAEDRLNRIGQDSVVQVIILQTRDTLDDGNILKTNRAKELIVKSIVAQEDIEHDWTKVEQRWGE